MPRPRKTIKSISKHIMLPEDIVLRMEDYLFSDVEGRIPQGAQQELIVSLLRDFFSKLDAASNSAN